MKQLPSLCNIQGLDTNIVGSRASSFFISFNINKKQQGDVTLVSYRKQVEVCNVVIQVKYRSVLSGTSRSYKYKNKGTGFRLQNTVEINKTTTSLTTVDWGIQRENNNNSVRSCINRANIKSTLPNQRISIHTLSYQIIVSNLVIEPKTT